MHTIGILLIVLGILSTITIVLLVHEEKNSPTIRLTQEKLDDGCDDEIEDATKYVEIVNK